MTSPQGPWDRYFSGETHFEVVFCGDNATLRPDDKALPPTPERRNDLWITTKYFDHGLEENLRQWREAGDFLDSIVNVGDSFGNEAVTVALIDARDRAREEARRAGEEIRMRREWAKKQPKEAELL